MPLSASMAGRRLLADSARQMMHRSDGGPDSAALICCPAALMVWLSRALWQLDLLVDEGHAYEPAEAAVAEAN